MLTNYSCPHMMTDFLCFVNKQLTAAQILGLAVGKAAISEIEQVLDWELADNPSDKVKVRSSGYVNYEFVNYCQMVVSTWF